MFQETRLRTQSFKKHCFVKKFNATKEIKWGKKYRGIKKFHLRISPLGPKFSCTFILHPKCNKKWFTANSVIDNIQLQPLSYWYCVIAGYWVIDIQFIQVNSSTNPLNHILFFQPLNFEKKVFAYTYISYHFELLRISLDSSIKAGGNSVCR